MRFHPVDVAAQSVDLAVMGQHAERLCQPPLRESIGGIALMIDRKGGFETRVQKVGIEFRNLFGQHHAFVDDRPTGKGADIHALDTGSDGGFLDPAADHV